MNSNADIKVIPVGDMIMGEKGQTGIALEHLGALGRGKNQQVGRLKLDRTTGSCRVKALSLKVQRTTRTAQTITAKGRSTLRWPLIRSV